MEENFVKNFAEEKYQLSQKMERLDEEMERLERGIKIEKEYANRRITSPIHKIRFLLKRDTIVSDFSGRFAFVQTGNDKTFKKIDKLGAKPKNCDTGVEMFKKLFDCYYVVNYGLGIVSQNIRGITDSFDATGGIEEIVGLLESLKDILKDNYEYIKALKQRADAYAERYGDYMERSLKVASSRARGYDDIE